MVGLPSRSSILALVLAGVGLALIGAVPQGGLVRADAATGASAANTVKGFQFQPKTLEINVGTTVVWTNEDDVTHIVASGTPEKPAGLFNGPLRGKGTRFAFTFSKAGTFPYFCDRHPMMRGQVVVKP